LEFRTALRESEAISHFLRESGRFPLCGRGDVNTYSVFAETMRGLVGPTGRAGIIVPTGIATDDTTKEFFQSIVEQRSLASLYDFENAAPIFEGVHRSYKFCLLTLSGSERPVEHPDFVFFAHRVEDLDDEDRRFRLSAADFKLLNPNTRTCPIFRTSRDAEITKGIYLRLPVFIDRTRRDGNPWGASFTRMFDMTNASGRFKRRTELEREGWVLDGNVFRKNQQAYIPLYEGKMFQLFDHRYANVVIGGGLIRQGQSDELTEAEHADPTRVPEPRYWVAKEDVPKLGTVALALRDVTSATNERTVIASLVPPIAFGDKAPLVLLDRPSAIRFASLAAVLSSFALDYVARTKVGAVKLAYFVIEQLPLPSPAVFADKCPWDVEQRLEEWLAPRVAELSATARDMVSLSEELGFAGAPFPWSEERRGFLRAELDAALFHLYGLQRDDVSYVLDTFRIIKRKEEGTLGQYRTKQMILERFDALSEAVNSGMPYRTVLDPLPAKVTVTA